MSEETPEKKNTGYTYWKRDIPDAHLLPSSAPRQIPHSNSEESLSGANRTSSSGLVSAWNAGTTYEEKNVTERAKKVLSDILSERDLLGNFFTVCNLKGEVHAHHVRGKVKIGFEISELELSADSAIKLKIAALDSTDLDEFTVDTEMAGNAKEVRHFVVQLMNDMCSTLLTE